MPSKGAFEFHTRNVLITSEPVYTFWERAAGLSGQRSANVQDDHGIASNANLPCE